MIGLSCANFTGIKHKCTNKIRNSPFTVPASARAHAHTERQPAKAVCKAAGVAYCKGPSKMKITVSIASFGDGCKGQPVRNPATAWVLRNPPARQQDSRNLPDTSRTFHFFPKLPPLQLLICPA